jgi:hypothetical protein
LNRRPKTCYPSSQSRPMPFRLLTCHWRSSWKEQIRLLSLHCTAIDYYMKVTSTTRVTRRSRAPSPRPNHSPQPWWVLPSTKAIFGVWTIQSPTTCQNCWDRSNSNPFSDDFLTYYSPDLRKTALESEIVEAPGQRFVYNDYNPLLVGMILERATGMSVCQYMESRLWQPMGAEGAGSWSLDSERSGFEKMFVGVNGRAIDLVKLGWLFLNGGKNGDVQVVSGRDTGTDPAAEYQYYWWIDEETGGYYAEGDKCQFIYVLPSADLVLARFGTDCGDYVFGVNWMRALAQYLETQLAPPE